MPILNQGGSHEIKPEVQEEVLSQVEQMCHNFGAAGLAAGWRVLMNDQHCIAEMAASASWAEYKRRALVRVAMDEEGSGQQPLFPHQLVHDLLLVANLHGSRM